MPDAPNIGADRRFRLLADSAPVMLWLSGRDGDCEFFNDVWLRFTGRSMEEEIGSGWAEGVHPQDFQACIDRYMRAFAAREEFEMEYRLRRFDGDYRWILDRGRPWFDEQGRFAGYIGSCTDITSLREAREAELRHARLEARLAERERSAARLEEANRHLEGFADAVAHDVGGALRQIQFVSSMLREQGTAGHVQLLGHLDERVRRLGDMVSGLRRLSSLTSGVLRCETVDMRAAAERAARDLRALEPAREIRWTIGEMPAAFGDRALIDRVWENLLGNAVKFTCHKVGATIEAGWDAAGGAWFVRDDGAGFAPELAEWIFDMFRRGHAGHQFEGSGVGLAVVRRIVDRHEGWVAAEGSPGHGATFRFTLGSGGGDG